MLSFSKLTLGLAAAVFAVTAQAKLTIPTYDELPDLKPEGVHQTACTRTANSFIRAHYKPIDVDNAFADKVLDRFLSYLDYNRSLLTQSEVDDIYNNRKRIISAIQQCDLSYPYEIYNQVLRKRFGKYSFFVDQIKQDKLDLTVDESVELDRHEAAYFKSEDEIRHEWLLELKNDYINQLLSDKTEDEVKERLQRRYNAALSKLGQTSSEDVFSIFENSFATAIDPHTSYLSPDDSESFNDNLNLSLEGIGAVLTSEDEYTVINSILPGSPAEKSKKLKAKDRIVGVRQQDGTYDDILGWRLNEVVKRIKGPKGSKVTLEIERGEGSQMTTFSVELTRDKVRLQDSEAKAEVKDYQGKKIAVLKIKSFYTNLHKDIQREIKRVKEENNGSIDALIIDLRNNGGGLLPEATLSSGLFIDQGPIVLVRDARGNVLPQNDVDKGVVYDGPLVVLINRLSASSSEIMAAALRDYGRALVVGDTSFGKGTVQQSKPLARVYDFSEEELGSIHYTIAKFYRINGGSTQLKGVEPDIYLPTLMDKDKIGESSEPNALPWDKISAVSYDGYLNIEAYVQSLTALSQARTKDNVFFKVTASDLARYQELKAKKVIPVSLEARKALKQEDDEYQLKTTNERLVAMGEKPVKKVKDLDEDFEFKDAILDETVAIASDFAAAQHEKIYSAKHTPLLQRYPAVQHDTLTDGHSTVSPLGAAVVPGPYVPPVKKDDFKLQTPSAQIATVQDGAALKADAASARGADAAQVDGAQANAAQADGAQTNGAQVVSSVKQDTIPHIGTMPELASSAELESATRIDSGIAADPRINPDGSFIGPWRTQNEDDTFLKVSNDDFMKMVKQARTMSNSLNLQDPVSTLPVNEHGVAVTNTADQGQIKLKLQL